MVKILLSGCNGQMGHVISNEVAKRGNCQIVAGVDINTDLFFDYPVYNNFTKVKEEIDVIIDFSNPSVIPNLLDYIAENHIPTVIATTGINEGKIDDIHKAAKQTPIFFTANMSIGINLLSELAQIAAKVLQQDFDIEIVEAHHNQKIDSPSGTALLLADAISEVLDEKPFYEYNRHDLRDKRMKNEIGIHSIRGGTIVGEHDIIFAGNDEILTLSHSARSKSVFAVGSINAALFLLSKKAGLYNMKDLIASQNK